MHDTEPSLWVRRFAPLIPSGGTVLDLACGSGRHARMLASMGYRVEAVDRDAAAIDALAGVNRITTRLADLENDPWPYASASFDGVVVTNYLHRPRFDALLVVLKPGGVLIYETFMVGNETLGKPSNPAFLLAPGELLAVVQGKLRVLGYEDLVVEHPRPAAVQRIAARRE